MSQAPEPTVLPVTLSAKSKPGQIQPVAVDVMEHPNHIENESIKHVKTMPIDYQNGRKKEPRMFNFQNYYNHRENLPKHYHPLVQFLEDTEVKYHNDNLFENSSIGFPTRAQILKERKIRLPIIKDTPEEKARYARKRDEIENQIQAAKKKYRFQTYEGFSDHCFLTGARFNRADTIDSKLLHNYGMFLGRKRPNAIYIKSNHEAFESISDDLFKMNIMNRNDTPDKLYKSRSCQVHKKPFSSKSAKSKQEVL